MHSFVNDQIVALIGSPPSPGGVRLYRLGVQALLGDEEAELHVFRATAAILPNLATASMLVRQAGAQALVDSLDLAKLSVFRPTAAILPDAATGSIRTHQAGGQALIDEQEPARLSVLRASAAILPNALGGLLVRQAGVQALLTAPSDADSEDQAPTVDPSIFSTTPFFLANWGPKVRITESWTTEEGRSSGEGNVEHLALADRPKRLLTFEWLFTRGKESDSNLRIKAQRLYRGLMELTSSRALLPLYPDVVKVEGTNEETDAVLWSSTTVLHSLTAATEPGGANALMSADGGSGETDEYLIDATNRRFHPNKPVAFFQRDGCLHLVQDSPKFGILETVDWPSKKITLKGQEIPVLDFDTGEWFVVPLVYCEIVSRPTYEVHSPDAFSVSIEAKEHFGPLALPAWTQPLADPLPYWSIAPNHAESVRAGYRRDIVSDSLGRDIYYEATGGRARHFQEWNVAGTREEWASWMTQWDGLRGRWRPQIVSEQTEIARPLGATGDKLYLLPDDYEGLTGAGFPQMRDRVEEAGFVVITKIDGTEIMRRVVNVVNDIITWTIVLETPVPGDLPFGTICRVYPARIYYFENDSVTQVWHTTKVVQMGFSLLEDEVPGDISIE